MGCGGGPGVALGPAHQPRSHGVGVDVGQRGQEMGRVQNARVVAALPQPPASVQAAVEILGILPGEMLHESAHTVRHLAGNDQMKVVEQVRMAVDHNLAEIRVVIEQREEFVAVLVREETAVGNFRAG